MKKFIVTLVVGAPDTVDDPAKWNWDALINQKGEKHTPVQAISCVKYPVPKENKH